MSRQSLIAKVHIAKKELGLDEDTYRQALQGVTGKASCSQMNDVDLDNVLQHFKRRGWKSKKRKYSPKTRDQKYHDQVDKLRAVWIDMSRVGMIADGSESALDAFVKRTTSQVNGGVGLDRTEWLRGREYNGLATTVLESLKQWQKRVLSKWRNEDLKAVFDEQARTDQPQAVVVQQLLDAQGIMWWPIFETLNIEPSERYCQNRRNLNHG